MLLMLAFICFFAMFAAWLIVPNVDEKAVTNSVPEPAPPGTANLQAQI
jgi:hypothetical protein